jgi:LysM repeat protein
LFAPGVLLVLIRNAGSPIVGAMKRLLMLICLALLGCTGAYAQDAATEERFNRVQGQLEDLMTAHKALQRQITELAQRVTELREQMARPNTSYVSHDDLKPLAESIREVDRKRIQDAEKIQSQLLTIQKLATTAATSKRPDKPAPTPERPQKGYEYQVQSGDTLSSIIQAYREQGVKVTLDQVLKANPDLKPERMPVGKVIFIPQL